MSDKERHIKAARSVPSFGVRSVTDEAAGVKRTDEEVETEQVNEVIVTIERLHITAS